MTWEDDLFALLDDLEQQADALYDVERAPELADRGRAEYQQVTLAGRLMATVGQPVQLGVRGAGPVSGDLHRVAAQWCLVSGSGQDWIVRLAAVTTVTGASTRSVPEVAWSPVARLGLGSALRRLAEAGERCVVHLADGTRQDGILARVGQDFAELVTAGDRRVLVAFDALAAVQSRD
ncbi:hypothetical protein NPS01_24040 [Nocardioides psychrotolerans]|uniref:Uncharacterized protein n=1 Tax=Nocardioides psychrotolerans TaxID=1005945 RepID=A0A1I3LC70_9ACTN|nr:hypothetical protein [Nocardioides psychrotolerans]GEP38741.1 hypothetical protein NPS01_24040 [Nocardioides psychrotolerans]SFI82297.1 hypothetical protein SAMN05216561_113100 [Nocardioides psychrotolerans]